MNTRPNLTLTPIAEIKAVVDLLADLDLDPLHLHIDGARPTDTRPDIKLWLRYRTDFVRVCEALRAKPVEQRYAPAGQRHWFAEHDTATGRLLVQVVSLPQPPRLRSKAGTAMNDTDEQGWIDRHGDVWRLGPDGLMHTPETQPFPREHVEKKWGPLRPVADIADLVERSSLGTPEALALRASVSDEDAARVVARAEELRTAERVIEKADGLGRTEPYSDPDLDELHDEDGEPIPNTLSAGWDVSFGCRVNFGPNPDGGLRISVHVSDQAKRAGLAVSPTTPGQLRALAAHLTAVAGDQDPTPSEPDADERERNIDYNLVLRIIGTDPNPGEALRSFVAQEVESALSRTPEIADHLVSLARVRAERRRHAAEVRDLWERLAVHCQERDLALEELADATAALDAAKAEALEAFAQREREMAMAWGGDLSWLTTGSKVAALVADWAREEAARLREQGGE